MEPQPSPSPANFTFTPPSALTFEQAFSELETIVSALESEDRPLDEALALFERGQILARHCAELLEHADLKVRQLSGEGLREFNE
jgi:exodeoxyribonuclease VII small subunit